MADAEKVVRLNPTWVKGHNRKALCLLRLGRTSDAARSYRAAIECDPENIEAIKALKNIEGTGSNNYYRERPSSPSANIPPSAPNFFSSMSQYAQSLDFGALWNWTKKQFSKITVQLLTYWSRLSDEHKRYIFISGFVVAGYFLFFHRSSSYYDYSSYDYGGSYYSGGGLSWSALAMIMYAAYKLPPMFPDQLGMQIFIINYFT